MTKTLEAIVQGNMIRPLEQLGLPENERVLVTVVTLQKDSRSQDLSCYEAMLRLGAIGVAKKTPPDLSTNPDYLHGMGT